MPIFVITHKQKPPLLNNVFKGFQVGSEKNIENDYLRDNILNNISDKNPNYCELTAAYWLWKNFKKNNYIGLAHYRRYFYFKDIFKIRKDSINEIDYFDFNKYSNSFLYVLVDIFLKIQTNRNYFFVPKSIEFGITIYEQYEKCHNSNDLDIVLSIIKKKHPDYEKTINIFFHKQTNLIIGNMMICSKENWDNYHEWLFDILFELEKNIQISEDSYQKRVFGFISERLLNLYLIHNNKKIKELNTIFIKS